MGIELVLVGWSGSRPSTTRLAEPAWPMIGSRPGVVVLRNGNLKGTSRLSTQDIGDNVCYELRDVGPNLLLFDETVGDA